MHVKVSASLPRSRLDGGRCGSFRRLGRGGTAGSYACVLTTHLLEATSWGVRTRLGWDGLRQVLGQASTPGFQLLHEYLGPVSKLHTRNQNH